MNNMKDGMIFFNGSPLQTFFENYKYKKITQKLHRSDIPMITINGENSYIPKLDKTLSQDLQHMAEINTLLTQHYGNNVNCTGFSIDNQNKKYYLSICDDSRTTYRYVVSKIQEWSIASRNSLGSMISETPYLPIGYNKNFLVEVDGSDIYLWCSKSSTSNIYGEYLQTLLRIKYEGINTNIENATEYTLPNLWSRWYWKSNFTWYSDQDRIAFLYVNMSTTPYTYFWVIFNLEDIKNNDFNTYETSNYISVYPDKVKVKEGYFGDTNYELYGSDMKENCIILFNNRYSGKSNSIGKPYYSKTDKPNNIDITGMGFFWNETEERFETIISSVYKSDPKTIQLWNATTGLPNNRFESGDA